MNDLKSNEEIKVCKLKNNTKTEILDDFLIVMVKGFGVTIGLILGAYVGSESVNYLYDSKLHNVEETVEEHMMLENHIERQGQIDTLKIEEKRETMTSLLTNFGKETDYLIKRYQEEVITKEQLEVIEIYLNDKLDRDTINLDGRTMELPKLPYRKVAVISLKGGEIFKGLIHQDETIKSVYDAKRLLDKRGYELVELKEIDFVETTLMLDTEIEKINFGFSYPTDTSYEITPSNIDEQISNIEQNFIKEKTDMEKMLEENIISENEAVMIITHMEDMKNKEIAKIVNEDEGYEKITTKSMTANALNVSLKGGDIIQVLLSPDEEIVGKVDAHLKLKNIGYAGLELEDIDYIDTTILVDTTGNGFDVSGYATRVIK